VQDVGSDSVARTRIDVIANTVQFGPALRAASKDFSKFGTALKAGFSEMRGSIGSIVSEVSPVFGSMFMAVTSGPGALATALIATTALTIKESFAMKELVNESRKMNLGVEEFQQLNLAAKQCNTDIENLKQGFFRMRIGISEAMSKDSNKRGIYNMLGLNVEELNRMSTYDAFMKEKQAIDSLGNSYLKAKTARELWGRTGKELGAITAQEIEDFKTYSVSEINTLAGAEMGRGLSKAQKRVNQQASSLPGKIMRLEWLTGELAYNIYNQGMASIIPGRDRRWQSAGFEEGLLMKERLRSKGDIAKEELEQILPGELLEKMAKDLETPGERFKNNIQLVAGALKHGMISDVTAGRWGSQLEEKYYKEIGKSGFSPAMSASSQQAYSAVMEYRYGTRNGTEEVKKELEKHTGLLQLIANERGYATRSTIADSPN
jgi:hypothetical protein